MTTVVEMNQASTCLPELVGRAANSEEIILSEAGKLLARIVAVTPEPPAPRLPRVPGGWEGLVIISDDFDDPLPPDLEAAFYGDDIEH